MVNTNMMHLALKKKLLRKERDGNLYPRPLESETAVTISGATKDTQQRD